MHVRLVVDAGHVQSARKELTALAGVSGVEVRAATIPAWSGGAIEFARLIHSKYVVIDGGAGAATKTAWVGSETWSEGYFMNTRDVGLMVSDRTVAAQLAQVFARLWSSGYVARL